METVTPAGLTPADGPAPDVTGPAITPAGLAPRADIGAPAAPVAAWAILALAGIGLGHADEAVATAREALTAKWRVHDRIGAAAVADLLVAAQAARGEDELAARLLGIGRHLWRTAGLPQLGSPDTTVFHREYERRLRASLGDARFTQAVREGAELGVEAAIGLALGGEGGAEGSGL